MTPMRIVSLASLENRTPHDIRLLPSSGVSVTLASIEVAPRVHVLRDEVAVVLAGGGRVPVHLARPCGVTDLPPSRPGRLLIVSRMVADAAPWRYDLLVPDLLERDERGVVIGCRSLVASSAPAAAIR